MNKKINAFLWSDDRIMFRKKEPEILCTVMSSTSQHLSDLEQSWLNPFYNIHFSIPTVLHICSQSFQNMNLMFSLSHLLFKTFSGLLVALRIKTELLNAAWSSPKLPSQPHLNHFSLCILPHWLFYSFMVNPVLPPSILHYALLDSF